MTTGYCEPCDDSCLLCYGSGNTKCSRCRTDPDNASALFYKHPKFDSCVADCPNGYYGDSDAYVCVMCHQSCKLCTNETYCTSCKNVTGIVYFNFDNSSCVFKCPDGYYGDESQNECVPCNETCSKCTGSSSGDCQACATYNGTTYYL